jgi:predicted DNA-binding transcriptional regulator AlpA
MPARKVRHFLNPPQAAAFLGISEPVLRAMLKKKLVPEPLNIGRGQKRYLRWKRADLQAFIDGKAVGVA